MTCVYCANKDAEIEKLKAENQRLREALEKVNKSMSTIRHCSQHYFYNLWEVIKTALEVQGC